MQYDYIWKRREIKKAWVERKKERKKSWGEKEIGGLVGFFVCWLINLHGLFNTKVILVEEQQWYLTHDWEDNEFMPFPRVLVRKWIEQLECEFTYPEAAVKY